jgi:hypothetical protein
VPVLSRLGHEIRPIFNVFSGLSCAALETAPLH